MHRRSVAMTNTTHDDLAAHLLRADGQEDVALVTYTVSTGSTRVTRILSDVHLPQEGDRLVHGNATINGSYVLRVAAHAARHSQGVAILHSHPRGRRWQQLSAPDADAERSYARLVEHLTHQPLLGLTLAGDHTWSARVWRDGEPEQVESVRRVGPATTISWNDQVVPPPPSGICQSRTISGWGEERQHSIARLRVLVVGAGSVGLDVVQRLAATGIAEIGVMDTDRVEQVNLDRMIGATRTDARRNRRKVDVAARQARRAATATAIQVHRHHTDVCSPEGLAAALDYDIIFSCVDRFWPRAVLNTVAYADLIPVIDGGIGIDTFDHGGMRGATRRTQTAVPGRPCLACSGQISMAEVSLEMSGDLDDPEYIRQAGIEPISGRPNVALLCAGVSAGQLDQFVSLVAHPAGQGVPAPLRFALAVHRLEHLPAASQPHCETEHRTGSGDSRVDLCRPMPPETTMLDHDAAAPRRPLLQNLLSASLTRLFNV